MKKGKLIGRGATADVFMWTDKTIIKIFKDHEPDALIDREVSNTKALENCSFKFPRFIQKLKYEGSGAVIYEKATGVSLLNQLESNPLKYKKIARKLAQLHFMVHENQVEGVQDQHSYFKEHISWSKDLTDEKKEKLYYLIDTMPAGTRLCHGDFHPGNVICSDNGDYIIDWADCCLGNRCADISLTILTLITAPVPDNTSKLMIRIIGFIRKKFCEEYTKEYLKISDVTSEQIHEWKVIAAAYRLCATTGVGKKTLLEILNSYFKENE